MIPLLTLLSCTAAPPPGPPALDPLTWSQPDEIYAHLRWVADGPILWAVGYTKVLRVDLNRGEAVRVVDIAGVDHMAASPSGERVFAGDHAVARIAPSGDVAIEGVDGRVVGLFYVDDGLVVATADKQHTVTIRSLDRRWPSRLFAVDCPREFCSVVAVYPRGEDAWVRLHAWDRVDFIETVVVLEGPGGGALQPVTSFVAPRPGFEAFEGWLAAAEAGRLPERSGVAELDDGRASVAMPPGVPPGEPAFAHAILEEERLTYVPVVGDWTRDGDTWVGLAGDYSCRLERPERAFSPAFAPGLCLRGRLVPYPDGWYYVSDVGSARLAPDGTRRAGGR